MLSKEKEQLINNIWNPKEAPKQKPLYERVRYYFFGEPGWFLDGIMLSIPGVIAFWLVILVLYTLIY